METLRSPLPEADDASSTDRPRRKATGRSLSLLLRNHAPSRTPAETAQTPTPDRVIAHSALVGALSSEKPDTPKLTESDRINTLGDTNPADTKTEALRQTVDTEPAAVTAPRPAAEAADTNAWPEYAPTPSSLFSGEVVIDLHGVDDTRTVEERVILLHPEVETEPVRPTVAASTAEGAGSAGTAEATTTPASPTETAPPAGGSGEVPPTEPPRTAQELYDQPPEPERTGGGAPVQTPEDQRRANRQVRVAAKREVKKALRKAHVRGGLLVGLLAGAGYEHAKHTRLERKAERQRKDLASKERQAADTRQAISLRENERLHAQTITHQATAERLAQTHQASLEKRIENAERLAAAAAAQAEAQTQEPLRAAEGHEITVSAWLAAETDKKTGKVIEHPSSFEYGPEYYKERAQETAARLQRLAAESAAAPATTQATGTTPYSVGNPHPSDSTVSGHSSGQPAQQASGSDDRPTHKLSNQVTAPLWPWVLALIGVVVGLVIVLG